ncbi:unnamed protein product, partial [Polarella glacialis]
VFHWISRAKASQRQRWREGHGGPAASEAAMGATEAGSNASFASLSQWYDHARTVWQTLSMCGTDLLQFRTMQQVLMAQQLQEFCDALVQKNVDGKLSSESEALIVRCTRELRGVTDSKDIHAIDNAFRGQLDGLRDAVLQEMHHEFDEFVKSHDRKFTDEQVKSDKRYSLVGPMRRKYASVDSLWRSAVHLALEQRSMDNLFEEISAKVNDLLLEQGANVNVQNVERVFEEKWSQVMAEQVRKMRPNLDKACQLLEREGRQEREAWTSVSVPLASCGNQAGLDPAFSSSHECNEEATYRRGVSLMSLGFLGVFGGFQAAQGLQTSLNATLGGLNLTCLYGTFTLLCLVAPPLLSGLEKVLGMRLLLLLCSLPYVAMALSNVIPMPAEPSSMWAVPMAMNVLVGVTAPLLWTA